MAKMVMVVQCFAALVGLVSVAGASVAMTGCKPKCGGIAIPYPFGMGNSRCFLNDWFEIRCNNNSRPFLKKLSLEVVEIGLDPNTLLVKHPIVMSRGCKGGDSLRVPNLTDTTLYLDPNENSFVGVGCNHRFEIANAKSFITGCITSCGGDERYCKNSLPPIQMKSLDVTFEQTVSAAVGSCAYAFIADNLWLDSRSSFSLRDLAYYVPVRVRWAISNEPIVRMQDGEQAFSCTPYSFDKQSHVTCLCSSGYGGNPYLPNGCQDINECKQEGVNYCMDTCVNTIGGYTCKQSPVKLIIIGIGSSFGLLMSMATAWCLYKVVKKRNETKRKKKLFRQNGGMLLEQQVKSSDGHVERTKVFTWEELEVATDHFNPNRILGRGGQGTVYKGMLPDGRIVAVKKSKIQNESNIVQQFINEVVILSRIDHRNVVKLLGCCLETETPLLVYEFVPNGTLSAYIHDQDENKVSWQMRLQIASDVAGALSYLHSAASIPIYHRDIKSTNILLGNNNIAKVSDFGTSRSVPMDQTHLSTLVQGTFGYFDPEYFLSSQFTDKSDVYSFGVVLVELLTGQKPICSTRAEEHRSLVAYFITSMEEKRLIDILDVSIAVDMKREGVEAVGDLARRCLNSQGRNRPTMRQVSMELERVIAMTPNGQQSYQEVEYVMEACNSLQPWNEVDSFTSYGPESASPQPLLPTSSTI